MTSIPVTFNGEEILMTGLTSRTTCGDVIYALLVADGIVNGYEWAIYEKWKDVERRLPDRTKITKTWKSWRSEQQNVQFVLQKSNSGNLRKSRSTKSSRKQRNLKVLEEYTVHELTMQIMDQQKVIAEQMQRMDELDSKIEKHETDLHLRRASQDGSDYVQQAYEIDRKCPDLADLTMSEREQYMEWCEKILELGEKLLDEEQKIHDLSLQVSVIENETEEAKPFDVTRKTSKHKHVSFSLEDNIRSVTPIEIESDTENGEVFQHDSDIPLSGQYNVSSGISRLFYWERPAAISSPCERYGTSDCDLNGTYVVSCSDAVPTSAYKIERNDYLYENVESESGVFTDQELSCKLPSSTSEYRDVSRQENRKACEKWCQQLNSIPRDAIQTTVDSGHENYPAVKHLPPLDIQPVDTHSREDSYNSCPSPSEIQVLAELNVGQKLKATRLNSDNDSDTGLSSMHSSDMSVLETLV